MVLHLLLFSLTSGLIKDKWILIEWILIEAKQIAPTVMGYVVGI